MTGVFETQTFQVCPTEPIALREKVGMFMEMK